MSTSGKEKGHLIIISGPSGVGKGTIRKQLFERLDLNLAYSVSYTTRLPRAGETHGVDYYFVSEQEFKQLVEKNHFLEWTYFVGNYYGTPEKETDEKLAQGKNVVLEIETDGAGVVMQKRPDALSIFLLPPSFEQLENRIRYRNSEENEVIKLRLSRASQEIECRKKYQYVVINDSVDAAVNRIAGIIRSH